MAGARFSSGSYRMASDLVGGQNRSCVKPKEFTSSPEGAGQSAAVHTSRATMSRKNMEITAITSDPDGSPPHQFSLELTGRATKTLEKHNSVREAKTWF